MSLAKRLIEHQAVDEIIPDKHLQSAQRGVRFVLRSMAAIENISEIDFETFTQWTKALSNAAFDLELAITLERESESIFC